jgi:hypothetical protein
MPEGRRDQGRPKLTLLLSAERYPKPLKVSTWRRTALGRDFGKAVVEEDRLCGLVARVLGYGSGGPGSIPGTTKKKVVGLERGPLSLVSTTEELLDKVVAAPV